MMVAAGVDVRWGRAPPLNKTPASTAFMAKVVGWTETMATPVPKRHHLEKMVTDAYDAGGFPRPEGHAEANTKKWWLRSKVYAHAKGAPPKICETLVACLKFWRPTEYQESVSTATATINEVLARQQQPLSTTRGASATVSPPAPASRFAVERGGSSSHRASVSPGNPAAWSRATTPAAAPTSLAGPRDGLLECTALLKNASVMINQAVDGLDSYTARVATAAHAPHRRNQHVIGVYRNALAPAVISVSQAVERATIVVMDRSLRGNDAAILVKQNTRKALDTWVVTGEEDGDASSRLSAAEAKILVSVRLFPWQLAPGVGGGGQNLEGHDFACKKALLRTVASHLNEKKKNGWKKRSKSAPKLVDSRLRKAIRAGVFDDRRVLSSKDPCVATWMTLFRVHVLGCKWDSEANGGMNPPFKSLRTLFGISKREAPRKRTMAPFQAPQANRVVLY